MLSLKLRIEALGPGFYNVCWMTSDMWMRMNGFLSQTNRRQETLTACELFIYFLKIS